MKTILNEIELAGIGMLWVIRYRMELISVSFINLNSTSINFTNSQLIKTRLNVEERKNVAERAEMKCIANGAC